MGLTEISIAYHSQSVRLAMLRNHASLSSTVICSFSLFDCSKVTKQLSQDKTFGRMGLNEASIFHLHIVWRKF